MECKYQAGQAVRPEEPLEMLDEAVHYSSVELVREINKMRKEINRLKSAL